MGHWRDNNGLADLHRAGFRDRRLSRPVELRYDMRVEPAAADEIDSSQGEIQAGRPPGSSQMSDKKTPSGIIGRTTLLTACAKWK